MCSIWTYVARRFGRFSKITRWEPRYFEVDHVSSQIVIFTTISHWHHYHFTWRRGSTRASRGCGICGRRGFKLCGEKQTRSHPWDHAPCVHGTCTVYSYLVQYCTSKGLAHHETSDVHDACSDRVGRGHADDSNRARRNPSAQGRCQCCP